MRAFEVHLNNARLCTAGIGNDGVLAIILRCVSGRDRLKGRDRDDMGLDIGGVVGPPKEYVRWRNVRLKVGDEVRVKVIKTELVDKPRKRYRPDVAKELRAKKGYVRQIAKELGWTITKQRGESK